MCAPETTQSELLCGCGGHPFSNGLGASIAPIQGVNAFVHSVGDVPTPLHTLQLTASTMTRADPTTCDLNTRKREQIALGSKIAPSATGRWHPEAPLALEARGRFSPCPACLGDRRSSCHELLPLAAGALLLQAGLLGGFALLLLDGGAVAKPVGGERHERGSAIGPLEKTQERMKTALFNIGAQNWNHVHSAMPEQNMFRY